MYTEDAHQPTWRMEGQEQGLCNSCRQDIQSIIFINHLIHVLNALSVADFFFPQEGKKLIQQFHFHFHFSY